MASKALAATHEELTALAEKHSCVAVAFSGGKDSLAVLHLASKHFKKVVPYFMYFVPGLRCEEERIEYANERFGVEVMRYPHPNFIASVRTSSYSDVYPELETMPQVSQDDVDRAVMKDVGASLVLTGEKKADGLWRRRTIAMTKQSKPYLIRPLKEWLKWEVLSYLKANNIEVPNQAMASNANVSLDDREILFLHDHYPSDYETLRSYFPYIEAVVWRREWFGRTDG